ncbi:MAG: thiamine biosynthesis protein ThiS [Puniceicoccaceae bacterium MED-G30]|jgi:sulfur carrier protein|nr:MAG: thiamine biosynthesis protein ThiS [Puniceicoccaceae bacterium MED-G30]
MKLSVNGEDREFPDGGRLGCLLDELALSSRKGVAVAVNQSVVPTREWGERELSEGDAVLVIQATQGG